MDAQAKLNAIQAAREPLEHELYSAELDMIVAEQATDDALVQGPKSRVAEIKRKLEALDKEAEKLR